MRRRARGRGGSSGPSSDDQPIAITRSQSVQFCEPRAADFPDETVSCAEGSATAAATVGDYPDCPSSTACASLDGCTPAGD